MKYLLLFALCGLSVAGVAQTVNNVPLKDIKTEYVQIVGSSNLLNTRISIELDFGQVNNYWSQRDTQLRDEKDKKVVFNSMIDALNFMSQNGYEFVQAYVFDIGNQQVYHYLMRRKKA